MVGNNQNEDNREEGPDDHFKDTAEKQGMFDAIDDANFSLGETGEALDAVLLQLTSTRELLHRYTVYFKVAVGCGIAALLVAFGVAFIQYGHYQVIDGHQSQLQVQQALLTEEATNRFYNDCLRANESRENIVDAVSVLVEMSIKNDPTPERTRRLQKYIKVVENKFLTIDCEKESLIIESKKSG